MARTRPKSTAIRAIVVEIIGAIAAVLDGYLIPRPYRSCFTMASKAGTKKARITSQPPVPIDTAKPLAPAKSANAVSNSVQDPLEQIRSRAYELYEQRGRQDGFHEQDWLQAESEILSRSRTSRTA